MLSQILLLDLLIVPGILGGLFLINIANPIGLLPHSLVATTRI